MKWSPCRIRDIIAKYEPSTGDFKRYNSVDPGTAGKNFKPYFLKTNLLKSLKFKATGPLFRTYVLLL